MPFGRLERTPPPAPMADINMTPLIDVMLVLLVIFLVTAPMLGARLELDLPPGAASPPAEAAARNRAITVTLDAGGAVTVDGEPLAADAWRARLADAARRDPATELHLRADRRAAYGDVAAVITAAQEAGLVRIGFATAPSPAPAPTPAPSPGR